MIQTYNPPRSFTYDTQEAMGSHAAQLARDGVDFDVLYLQGRPEAIAELSRRARLGEIEHERRRKKAKSARAARKRNR